MVAVAGGDDVPCTPYHLFGTEALSQAVGAAFAERQACLMANHGLVAGGTTLAQAMKVALEIESLCGIYLQALAVASRRCCRAPRWPRSSSASSPTAAPGCAATRRRHSPADGSTPAGGRR